MRPSSRKMYRDPVHLFYDLTIQCFTASKNGCLPTEWEHDNCSYAYKWLQLSENLPFRTPGQLPNLSLCNIPKQMHRTIDNCSSGENTNHSEKCLSSVFLNTLKIETSNSPPNNFWDWISCAPVTLLSSWSEPLGPPRLTEWVASLITGSSSPWDIMPLYTPQHPSISCSRPFKD